MTTEHVVEDDVLGKVSRRIWDLTRRVLEGSVDPERVLAILQLALEGIPKLGDYGTSHGTYLLESHWTFDNFHREFATINLEKCDSDISFEALLNPSVPQKKKDFLVRTLKGIYEAQVPTHGGHKMVRLYRVLSVRDFGYVSFSGPSAMLEREAVDVHLILKPLVDFNYQGEMIPSCVIKKS